jgi:hypothetical protein
MDIQQYILNNTGVLLPISGGNVLSQCNAVVIGSEGKYRLYTVVEMVFVNGKFYK